MTSVIRVEYTDGFGMFMTYKDHLRRDIYDEPEIETLLYKISRRHGQFNTPSEDGLDIHKGGEEWFCAYKTIDQLKEWVTSEELTTLSSIGFKVYLIKVTEYQIGPDQVIYTKEGIETKEDVTALFIN